MELVYKNTSKYRKNGTITSFDKYYGLGCLLSILKSLKNTKIN